MDLGWRLFVHAFLLVYRNFGKAIKLTLLLSLAPIIIELVFSPDFMAFDQGAAGRGQSGAGGFGSVLSFFAGWLCIGWIAVGWHRYVLLEEDPPRPFPVFRGREILSFIWRSILIIPLIFVPMLIWMVIVQIASAGQQGDLTFFYILMFGPVAIFAPVSIWVVLRISLVFPALSVGDDFGFEGSWVLTREASRPIFWLAVICLAGVLTVEVFLYLLAAAPVLQFALSAIYYWISLVFGISLATTLYGFIVEGRPLA